MLVEKSPLPTWEIGANFGIWTGMVFYGIYQFYKQCSVFDNYEDPYDDFQQGWIFPNRKLDVSDSEWKSLIPFALKLIPFLFIHIIVTQLLKSINRFDLIRFAQLSMSIIYITLTSNVYMVLLLAVQPLTFFLLMKFKNSILIRCCFAVLLLSAMTFNDYLTTLLIYLHRHEDQIHCFHAIFWISLRCVSYSIDLIESNREGDLIDMLAYVLYLPVLHFGPVVLYKDYVSSLTESKTNCIQRFKKFSILFARLMFWIFVRELISHFIYVNAMQFHVEYVDSFTPTPRYGYGYFVGQYFQIKYVVFYGIGIAFGRFEGAVMPGIPKCIGRIHLYSDMWKYFDEGLYQFIVKYIYIPLQLTNNIMGKLIASWICFIFIFVWHGVTQTILIWTVLNYFVVTSEALWKYFYKKNYDKFKNISPAWKQRLHALIAAPIFAIAVMSNFYFLINLEIGHIYFRKFFYGEFTATLLVLCVMYAGCNVSIEVKRWEDRKKHVKEQ